MLIGNKGFLVCRAALVPGSRHYDLARNVAGNICFGVVVVVVFSAGLAGIADISLVHLIYFVILVKLFFFLLVNRKQ